MKKAILVALLLFTSASNAIPSKKANWYVPGQCVRDIKWGPKPCEQLTETTMVCKQIVVTISCVSVSRPDSNKMDVIIPVPANLKAKKDLQDLLDVLK